MENQEEQKQPELGIADLQNVKTLLEVAVRRGAFAAAEMTSVGSVYDRLNAFLTAVAPAQPAKETAESGEGQEQTPAQ